MTTTPVPARDGLPSAATATHEGSLLHQGAEEMALSLDHSVVDVLDGHRQAAELSHAELWLRYLELGGIRTGADVEAILCGVLVPSDHDHDVIALALNERFAEMGKGHPVPYATE
jgi:hypothetical protein